MTNEASMFISGEDEQGLFSNQFMLQGGPRSPTEGLLPKIAVNF